MGLDPFAFLALLEQASLRGNFYYRRVGVWLSLVEHTVRDRGVAGSNPVTPTTCSLLRKFLRLRTWQKRR